MSINQYRGPSSEAHRTLASSCIGPNLANNIVPPSGDESNFDYMKAPVTDSMFLFDTDDCLDCTRVQTKKIYWYDGINMNIIKSVVKSISKALVYICNLSLSSGIFPDDMKIARVISLYKAGENDLFTNYRPVSLLPQFSKILEKIYYSRLDKFISKHYILSNSQFGFKQYMSIILALLQFVEEISSSIDKKNKTIGAFIDLKKAFDTIDHDILFKKLDRYGVRGISNNWVKSYLTGRKKYANIDIATSGMLQIYFLVENV